VNATLPIPWYSTLVFRPLTRMVVVGAHCSEVRKQTCDLITLMEMGAATSQYYMFMEDDFRV
jgi:hypothetical protein